MWEKCSVLCEPNTTAGPSAKTKVEKECKDLVLGEKQNQTTSGDVFLETSNIPLLSWGCSWAVFVP